MEVVATRELRTSVEEAAGLYHRLVLVSGPPGHGKTRILRVLSEELACPLVNLNLQLAERLLELTRRQRALETPRLVGEILDATESETVALDNIELLFSRELAQDPLALLRGLSRNRTLVAVWPGQFVEGILAYAEPGHPEFRRYPRPEGLLIHAIASGAQDPATQHSAAS